MANLLSTTVNGSLNVQGSSMYVTASQLHIGKASSGTAQMSFESWGSYTGAIAMNSSGAFHWGGQGNSEWYFKKNNTYNGDYSASGTTVLRIASDGNIWSAYYSDWLSNIFNSKQNASTAITTSNIGSQSVNYASSAGNADTVDGRHADYFYPASTDNGYSTGDIYGSGTHQRLWGTDSVQNLLAFRPPTSIEYSTDGVNWTATTATTGLWDNKMFGKWGGFNMAVGNNVGGWRYVRMTWVNFGYHFFSHFTLAHSTNGHSFNFVFQKSDLNGVFSGEAFRQNGISSWPGYTFTKHSNVSGWWDTRDIRFVFELNHNNDFPNNSISIGHIGLMGGYSGFTRLYDWDADRNMFFGGVVYAATGNSNNWNTAYGWGNHATAGYQAAATAITTSNIGSQSVSYADESGYSASSGSVEWTSVQNKPATFAPSAHNHDDRYYTESESDGRYVPYGSVTGSFGLNDNKLYLRTNGDNNHYLWNAADDWEELVYYTGTGFRIKGSTGVVAGYFTDSEVKLNARLTVGNFPQSTTNTGEAWVGRANDRNTGTLTVQLGGNSASSRSFEVVDYAWSTVLFSVNSNNTVSVNNYLEAGSSLRAPIFYDSADTGYYVDPNSNSKLLNLGLGGATPDIRLSVSGDAHVSGYIYQGGTAGVVNSWGSRTYVNSGNYVSNARSFAFNNVGYGSSWTFAISSDGAVTTSRHIDANTTWTNSATTLFLGWYGGKVVIGNNNEANHDNAAALGGNTIAITNTLYSFEQSNLYYDGSLMLYMGSDGTRNTGWAYHTNNGAGLHWPNNGWHLMPHSSADFRIYSGSGSESALRFETTGSIRGYVYANNSNEIGFLNNDRAWRLRAYPGGAVESYGDFRAPIFYDSDDTTYYLDPNSNVSGIFAGSVGINNTSPINTAWGTATTTKQLSINGTNYAVINLLGGSRRFSMGVGDAQFYMCYDNNAGRHNIIVGSDGSAVFATDVRAPIFYDSNDTGYYGNFAGFSRMSEIGVTNHYVYNYDSIDSGRAVGEFGHVGKYVSTQSASTNYIPFSFENRYGNHSWGHVARFHVSSGSGTDRPSIQFSSGYNNTRWSVGYCSATDDNFRVTQNMGMRPDNSGNHDEWGTERFRINTDGSIYISSSLQAYSYQGHSNVAGTGNASYHPSGIYSTGTNWLYGTMYMNNNSIRDVQEIYNNGWFRTVGHQGLYNPTNDAHFYPNNASYGSWRIDGTRNGWHGIYFGSGATLMMNSGETGIYRENYGWQFRWYQGEMYISPNTLGGGTERTVIHSGNIGSQSVSYASSAGGVSWANVTSKPSRWLGEANLIYDNAPDTAVESGFWQSYLGSGNPTGTWFNYINVRHSNTGNVHGYQLGMSYYDNNLWFRSYQGNGTYQSWSRALGTNTDPYPSNMNQYVRTTDDVTHNSTTSPTFLVNSHSDNTKGYRIHNTSGTSVSAMFTNSSNQLVIAAGAFDQINLNKKVYVNGVALGVNVAPSATAGRIDASNDIVAYSSSDERLKYNITPIENAIDKVKSLTGVEFDWKPEYKHAHGYEGHDTGIIAQQVQEVIPSAVRTNDTGFLAVRYEKLIGLLVEGMKEQQAQIEELKAKLDGLTN